MTDVLLVGTPNAALKPDTSSSSPSRSTRSIILRKTTNDLPAMSRHSEYFSSLFPGKYYNRASPFGS